MADVYTTVKSVMDKYGIPEWIWKPIMLTESEGNPNNVYITGSEASYGLFQINRFAHPEYSIDDLLNPAKNAEIAAVDFILPALNTVVPDLNKPDLKTAQIIYTGLNNPDNISEGYLTSGGIRPDWKIQSTRDRFNKYFLEVTGGKVGGFVDLLPGGELPESNIIIPALNNWQNGLKIVFIIIIIIAIFISLISLLQNTETGKNIMSGIQSTALKVATKGAVG